MDGYTEISASGNRATFVIGSLSGLGLEAQQATYLRSELRLRPLRVERRTRPDHSRPVRFSAWRRYHVRRDISSLSQGFLALGGAPRSEGGLFLRRAG